MLPDNENLLVLCHPECDYGAQMVFNGFAEVLGPGRVLPYPDKLSYYGQTHKYSLSNIPNGETSPTPWAVPIPRPYTGHYKDAEGVEHEDSNPVHEIRAMLRDGIIRCVFVESLREWAVNAYNELAQDIQNAGATVILLESEDHPDVRWKLVKQINPRILLKREMRKDCYSSGDMTLEGVRVLGFPFSACTTSIFEVCPEYYPTLVHNDVTFMCGRTASFRQWIADTLRCQEDLRMNVAISPDDRNRPETLLVWPEYIKAMHKSWIAVSAKGFGNDCVRFWEAISVAPVFSENPNLYMENPVLPDEHYIEIDSSNMMSRIRYWLGRKEDLLSLYRRGREHVVGCHSNAARAKRILNLFNEYRSG